MCWHAALPARPQRQWEGQLGGWFTVHLLMHQRTGRTTYQHCWFHVFTMEEKLPRYFPLIYICQHWRCVYLFILLANQPRDVPRQVPINTGIWIVKTVDDTQTPNTNEGKSRNRGGNGWEVCFVFEEYYFLTEEGQHWSQVCGLWIQQPLMYFFFKFIFSFNLNIYEWKGSNVRPELPISHHQNCLLRINNCDSMQQPSFFLLGGVISDPSSRLMCVCEIRVLTWSQKFNVG